MSRHIISADQRLAEMRGVKPRAARTGQAGAVARCRQYEAIEGVAGSILILTGANSVVGLRSTPARYLFPKEVDAYPASADEKGDPVSLAAARALTFAHRCTARLISTPTTRGAARIARTLALGDERRHGVPWNFVPRTMLPGRSIPRSGAWEG